MGFNKFSRGGDRGGDRGFGGGRSGGGFGGGNGGRSFGGGRKSDGPRQMFPAVCGDCGQNCEVPFRPTDAFPVFCTSCFKAQGGDKARMNDKPRFDKPRFAPKSFGDRGARPFENHTTTPNVGSVSKAQFEALSAKVDRILDLLLAPTLKVETTVPKMENALGSKESKKSTEKTEKVPAKKSKGKKK